MKRLETELGRDLVVHKRRPMELTRNGKAYLTHVRAALQHLRQGASELLMNEMGTIRSLRIGIIDDFNSEVSAQLGVALAIGAQGVYRHRTCCCHVSEFFR